MGKTNPTYRDELRSFRQSWEPFYRALRRQHKPHFDRLFDQAGNFADAAGHQNPIDPEIGIVFSILLAQEERIAQLEEQLADAETTD